MGIGVAGRNTKGCESSSKLEDDLMLAGDNAAVGMGKGPGPGGRGGCRENTRHVI